MSNKVEKRLVLILLLVGITLVIGASTLFCYYRITKVKYQEVKATIVDYYKDEDSGWTEIEYYVDEVKYIKILSQYSSTYYIGKIITIEYLREDPSIVRSSLGFILGSAICSFVGLIFFSFGAVVYFIDHKNQKIKKRALYKGRKIIATVDNIEDNWMYMINGYHPQIITCTLETYDGIKTIKSKREWINSQYCENLIVDVYYLDDKVFFIDIETLRKKEEVEGENNGKKSILKGQ